MANKLTCKHCGYKSGNLYQHLVEAHGGVDGAKAYHDEHGIDAVIHSSLQEKFLGAKMKILETEASVRAVSEALKPYVPTIEDAYHFQPFAADLLLDLTEDRTVPTMLTGHTGTGKSSLYAQIAARLNQPVLRVNMNNQATISDFVGLWTVKAGETIWVDGALPWCMKNGVWLIIDEIDFAEPAILSVLNSVLERGGMLHLKEKGDEVVRAHKNFRICATANTAGCMSEFRHLYQGTNILNEAFMDRWRVYVVAYMEAAAEAAVLKNTVTGMTERIAASMVDIANACRKSFVEEDLASSFSTRRLLDWGYLLVRYAGKYRAEAPLKAAEAAIFSKVSKEDKIAIEGIIQRKLKTSRSS